jgi:hypothetical protein
MRRIKTTALSSLMETRMSDHINHDRRRFFGIAAMTIAAAQFGMIGSAKAQSAKDATAIRPGTNTSFGALKQIDAGLLSVGYAEVGPADGRAPQAFAQTIVDVDGY